MITLVPVITPIVDARWSGSIVGGRRIVLGRRIVGSSLIAPIVIPIISSIGITVVVSARRTITIGITVVGSSSGDGSEYSQPDANSDGGIAATSPSRIRWECCRDSQDSGGRENQELFHGRILLRFPPYHEYDICQSFVVR